MEKDKGSFRVPLLTKESLATLDDGMWLNDIVMDIALRSVHEELRRHIRRKSLIYPVYFYTKLKTSGFSGVINWTKHEDIFRKDYLLIVENVLRNHWRLMIVCFPGNEEVEHIKKGRKLVQKRRPCILMLDSQSEQVSDSMDVFQNIRSYLTEMWNHTRKKPRTFSADSMPALKVRVPEQQGNTSECGIFVLLYAENFLKDPPKELIDELDCTSWFTLADAFSKRAQIRDKMRSSLEAHERAAEENKAEQRESEEEQTVAESGQEKNIAKKRKIEVIEEEKIPEGKKEGNTTQGGNYTVLGRLSVPGTKRKYIVTQDELKRRIMAENMSNNLLRSLIRVRKEDLPEELKEQRPIKAKTKISIFSALSEGEATDLAQELGAMLGRHVNLDMTASVPSAEADVAKNTLCTLQRLLREKLGEESPFSLLTHTLGPQVVDVVISFLISQFK
ncbi:sentrin-specific protease 6-like [Pimephales promelas]|uniref:sentrin-specific protease 6-like n=1 Tax=Pimephales promelas TaxID=90988 RepID=UPI001955D225|nr:sentrin-specific protease 6-like [Pimephales promelas]XP_039525175.1 sentrin-specific protease 6-like [Pimephales promelas]KAG1952469.1 sentrin-specific protease [Pimephales promelas]